MQEGWWIGAKTITTEDTKVHKGKSRVRRNVAQEERAGPCEPAPKLFSLDNSESDLQAELDQTWKVDRVRHLPEGCTGLSSVRRSELGMIEQVEKFRAEFDTQSLRDVRPLEYREVKVVDSLLTDRCIYTGFIAEGPRVDLRACRIHATRRGEAGGVEPLRDARNSASASALVAASDIVGPKRALSQEA